MSGGNSLYESQDLLGAVGEAKASTQNQDAEARRPEAGDGSGGIYRDLSRDNGGGGRG